METSGWDIVSACSQSKINDLLKSRMAAMPAKVTWDDKAGHTVDATFDPWQITGFGTDRKLTVELPIAQGTMTSTGKFAAFPKVDLAGVVVEVTISLVFVDNAAGTASDLSFNISHVAQSKSDQTEGAVYVKAADLTQKLHKLDPSGGVAMNLGKLLCSALVAHGDKLKYALGTVNLQPGAGWMKPVEKAHMFAPGKAGGDGFLAVATMVRDLPANTRSRTLDPSLFDTGHDFFMIVAGDVFLENFLMPTLGKGFVNDPKTFSMAGDSVVSFLPLQCNEVDHWGTGYHPVLNTFRLSIDGKTLNSEFTGWFQITGLGSKAYVTFSGQQNMSCSYDAKAGSISFEAAKSPDPEWHKHLPWYEWAAAAVVAPIAGPIIAGVMVGVMDAIIAGVMAGVTDSVLQAKGTTGLDAVADIAVTWPGSTGCRIDECGLDTAFYVRGRVT